VREYYPDRIPDVYPVFPSIEIDGSEIELINLVLSMHQMIENADLYRPIDNHGLYQACFKSLKIKEPSREDLNDAIANSWVETTATYTHPFRNHISLPKLATTLKPFPRLSGLTQSVKIHLKDDKRDDFITNLHSLKNNIWEIETREKIIGSALLMRAEKEYGDAFTRGLLDYRKENKYDYYF